MKTEKTIVTYSAKVELSEDDVKHLREIAIRLNSTEARWALRKCVPGVSVRDALDLIHEIVADTK